MDNNPKKLLKIIQTLIFTHKFDEASNLILNLDFDEPNNLMTFLLYSLFVGDKDNLIRKFADFLEKIKKDPFPHIKIMNELYKYHGIHLGRFIKELLTVTFKRKFIFSHHFNPQKPMGDLTPIGKRIQESFYWYNNRIAITQFLVDTKHDICVIFGMKYYSLDNITHWIGNRSFLMAQLSTKRSTIYLKQLHKLGKLIFDRHALIMACQMGLPEHLELVCDHYEGKISRVHFLEIINYYSNNTDKAFEYSNIDELNKLRDSFDIKLQSYFELEKQPKSKNKKLSEERILEDKLKILLKYYKITQNDFEILTFDKIKLSNYKDYNLEINDHILEIMDKMDFHPYYVSKKKYTSFRIFKLGSSKQIFEYVNNNDDITYGDLLYLSQRKMLNELLYVLKKCNMVLDKKLIKNLYSFNGKVQVGEFLSKAYLELVDRYVYLLQYETINETNDKKQKTIKIKS
jgi:hypothetical protein